MFLAALIRLICVFIFVDVKHFYKMYYKIAYYNVCKQLVSW